MIQDKIQVTWEVADGYAGKSRPQTTRIRREEIESAIDEADVREIIEQSIQSDFESKIAPDYGESAYTEALEIWKQAQAEK
jgi:ribosomal protein S26